jgi:membrane associated rhomboid family serine protease
MTPGAEDRGGGVRLDVSGDHGSSWASRRQNEVTPQRAAAGKVQPEHPEHPELEKSASTLRREGKRRAMQHGKKNCSDWLKYCIICFVEFLENFFGGVPELPDEWPQEDLEDIMEAQWEKLEAWLSYFGCLRDLFGKINGAADGAWQDIGDGLQQIDVLNVFGGDAEQGLAGGAQDGVGGQSPQSGTVSADDKSLLDRAKGEWITDMSPGATGGIASWNRLPDSGDPKTRIVPVDGIAWFTKIHVNEVATNLTRLAAKGEAKLKVESTSGFVRGQVVVVDAGSDQEEVNKVVRVGTILGFTATDLVLETPLKFDHGKGATIAVEDAHWLCPACRAVNKHARVSCHACGGDRPPQEGDSDKILLQLRDALRQEYGQMMLARWQDGQPLLPKPFSHICDCGEHLSPDALFCKTCGRNQSIDCPTPDCLGRVKPSEMCRKCFKTPDKDTIQLANFAERVFKHKRIRGRINEAIATAKEKGNKDKVARYEQHLRAKKLMLPDDVKLTRASEVLMKASKVRQVLTFEEFDSGLRGILREVGLTEPFDLRPLYEKQLNQVKAATPDSPGIDVMLFRAMLFRLLPFLRASGDELEAFQNFQTSSAQAAIPWCPHHEIPDPENCKYCRAQMDAIDALRAAGRKVPTRPLRLQGGTSTAIRESWEQSVVAAGANVVFPGFVDDEKRREDHAKEKAKKKTKDEKIQVWENTRIRNSRVVPWFILGQSAFAFLIWAGFALKESSDPTKAKGRAWTDIMAGMESIWPDQTALKTHVDCEFDLRPEVWRWFTYQWTHVGISHVGFNCILNLVLGWRLEKLHGNLMMALFYNLGVFGGACCYFCNDVHIAVVGMSGGCYSLIGMHWGYWIINFKQKRYRWLTFFVLVLMNGIDLFTYFTTMSDHEPGEPKVSHSAHFGGAVTGLMVVILFGENIKEQWFEPPLKVFIGVLAFGLLVLCLVWRLVAWAPYDIWDMEPWCWTTLAYNSTLFGDTEWHCVSCASEACVLAWQAPYQLWTTPATHAECVEKYGGYALRG